MQIRRHLRLEDIETWVCDIASRELDIPREKVTPASRLIEDLHCDSIDLIELVKEFEEAFDVTLPNDAPNGVCKSRVTGIRSERGGSWTGPAFRNLSRGQNWSSRVLCVRIAYTP